jgi:predicted phage terminase large subunit-like protein
MWHAVEPETPLVKGWPLDAMSEHLQAVSNGDIKRLLINVFPGACKSLTTNVFWPAFIWGPDNKPAKRFIAASYSQKLTIRDNIRFRQIIMSDLYKELWGDRFGPSKDKFTTIEVGNDKLGWKLAGSVGSAMTGFRGDFILLDDPNSVQEAESDSIRESTNDWFRETLPTRLNSAKDSAIVVIQQRTHQTDISGTILDLGLDYTHLSIPAEYDSQRNCVTVIKRDKDGKAVDWWADPRGLDDDGYELTGGDLDAADGALAWPERFPKSELVKLEAALGPYAYSGQFQQIPSPRGGGIFKTDWWRSWPPQDWDDIQRAQYARKMPDFSYIVAALDPALTEKQENDYSALTIWGVWQLPPGIARTTTLSFDGTGGLRVQNPDEPKIMLRFAWQKRLQLHGPKEEKPEHLTAQEWSSPKWLEQRQKEWGLVEWVAHTCRVYKVDHLLIENKAGGQHVVSELQRLLSQWDFGVSPVDPGRQDKVARAHSVVHLFSNGIIYAPTEMSWFEDLQLQAARFPRAKNDDLVDSMIIALQHLRDTRHALRSEEVVADYEDELRAPGRSRPLYPV